MQEFRHILRAHHRETRDLDLFWYGTETITRLAEAVRDRPRTVDELQLQTMQTSPRFVRLRVSKENTTTLVDLVASPGEPLGPSDEIEVEGRTIRVDAEQEPLTTKLCALPGRSELRDLWDTKVLLERGASLERALEAAPRQDAGFSIPTFAWILESLDVEMLAVSIGLAAEQAGRLDAFKLHSATGKLLENPELGMRLGSEIRRLVLRRFPYNLIKRSFVHCLILTSPAYVVHCADDVGRGQVSDSEPRLRATLGR